MDVHSCKKNVPHQSNCRYNNNEKQNCDMSFEYLCNLTAVTWLEMKPKRCWAEIDIEEANPLATLHGQRCYHVTINHPAGINCHVPPGTLLSIISHRSNERKRFPART